MRKFVTIGLLALLLQSCGKVAAPEFVGVNNINITEAKLSHITAAANVKVYNPNKHSITIKSADVDVTMRDIKAGKLLVDEPIKIAARSYADCDFTIKLNTVETLKVGITSAREWLLNSGNIKLTGTVDGEYGIFKRKIAVDTSVKIGDIVPQSKRKQTEL
ncbi:MAG: LEA type 2 family protein [Salinivirgaceae bacterium]|nr:LEA type 2 family protein [Salinivirgaceae bacterium]